MRCIKLVEMGCHKLTYYPDFDFKVKHSKKRLTSESCGFNACSSLTFGMPISGRTYNAQNYAFGFNGKLKDTEWTGNEGSHLDFGARVYDSRIGRWTATDPLAAKYPSLSPYAFVGNMPIIAVDPDGERIVIKYRDDNGKRQKYVYQPGVEYEGDNEFVKQTVTALNVLNENDTKGIIQNLSDMKRIRRIKHTTDEGENSVFRNRARSNTIYWNPKEGTEVVGDDGYPPPYNEYQAPAIGLYHELAHAYNEMTEKVKYWIRRFTKDENYSTKEERYVITNFENPMSILLGNPIRTNHFGGPVETSGPLSNEPINNQDFLPTEVERKSLDIEVTQPEIKKPKLREFKKIDDENN